MTFCEHRSFIAETRVGRTSDTVDGGVTWAIDVRVRCAECDLPFRFVGTPGLSNDGKTARLPVEPAYTLDMGLDAESDRQESLYIDPLTGDGRAIIRNNKCRAYRDDGD